MPDAEGYTEDIVFDGPDVDYVEFSDTEPWQRDYAIWDVYRLGLGLGLGLSLIHI